MPDSDRPDPAQLLRRVEQLEAELVALRAGEEQFRRLAENASDMIYRYEIQPRRRFAYVSPAATELTGYTPADYYADPELSVKITHPADRPIIRTLLAGKFVWDVPVTLRWQRRDGILVWTEQTNTPILDAAGDLVALEGIVRDVTRRKEAEDALRRTAKRLELLHTIDRDILAAHSPEATAQAALRHMRQLIDCRFAGLGVLEAGSVVVLAADDPAGELPRLPGLPTALQHGETASVDMAAGPRLIYLPVAAQERLIGVLILGLEPGGELPPDHLDIARDVANSAALAIQNAALFRSVVEQHDQLRLLTARLSELEEIGRQRLARELHDRIGQNLTALGINLNIVRAQLPADAEPRTVNRIDDSLQLVAETVERVRDVMSDLRPPVLDDYGLLATLKWHGERFGALTGVAVEVNGSEFEPRLPLITELAVFRIAQEALNNVARHARASRVDITLIRRASQAQIVIADDGVGFDPLTRPRAARPTWGLLTMRERAEAVDGRVDIDTAPGQGTRVIITIERTVTT
jgi:PAS domain S-box-containing protein